MTTRVLNAADRGAGPYLWRFTRQQRVLHIMVIVSFYGLVLTGVPLFFSYAPWARGLVNLVGGLESAAIIHRICAVITFLYFFIHVGTLIRDMRREGSVKKFFWGPDSMIPQPKDVRDVIGMFKWFLGLGPQPKFERFSYMEKVDYLADLWGVFVFGTTGLFLWFPGFFAQFLPGWIFNVSTVIHGVEALLALSFIFTIHFFNVHFRPQKFPIDLVIFTGRGTTEYMKEEHPLEYERLVETGQLQQRVAPPASRGVYMAAMVFGFTSLFLGVGIIGLVLYAVVRG